MSVKEEELLEEISGFLHGYLKSGKVRINSFLSKMNVNIANLEQLLTIRFLLLDETRTFVQELPQLLQRFKTNTVLQNETAIGEVRGQINWPLTIKNRMARNPKDRTLFTTSENIRSYDIPENLILKELLRILHTTLFRNDYIKGFEKAAWFAEWQSLKGNIANALKKNIYLQRVDNVTVSDRVLLKTLNHRNKLYRNAARLLVSYRRIKNGDIDEEDTKELLRQTFIAPDNVDVLFELYWIVKLIEEKTEDSELHLMDGSSNMVASWEKDEHVYNLYHDSTGSDQLKFHIGLSEIADSDNPYLIQKYTSATAITQLTKDAFDKTVSSAVWRGRPDFLLETYDKQTGQLTNVLIGEVKNTSRVNYAMTGLEELVHYIHLVKDHKGEYLLDSAVSVKGMLCLGNVPFNEDFNSDVISIKRRTS